MDTGRSLGAGSTDFLLSQTFNGTLQWEVEEISGKGHSGTWEFTTVDIYQPVWWYFSILTTGIAFPVCVG